YIALSVTAPYNLIAAKKTIEEIKKHCLCSETKIIVGGQAFANNPSAFKLVGADILVQTYEDVRKLSRSDDF
ncbi:MAG: cobalamin-binding protein, partial [Thermoplasmata archaeon]